MLVEEKVLLLLLVLPSTAATKSLLVLNLGHMEPMSFPNFSLWAEIACGHSLCDDSGPLFPCVYLAWAVCSGLCFSYHYEDYREWKKSPKEFSASKLWGTRMVGPWWLPERDAVR